MTMLTTFARYNRWANRLVFDALALRDVAALQAPQPVVFGSLLATVHHVLAMSEVWQAHLEGRPHGYTSRMPAPGPGLAEIAARQGAIDDWLVDLCADGGDWDARVAFTFIGGGAGAMTRGQIVLHLVNHATYHRGHIAACLNAMGHGLPASDLPVFLAAGG